MAVRGAWGPAFVILLKGQAKCHFASLQSYHQRLAVLGYRQRIGPQEVEGLPVLWRTQWILFAVLVLTNSGLLHYQDAANNSD